MVMESPEAAVPLLVWAHIKEMAEGDNSTDWYYKLKFHGAQFRWLDLKAGGFAGKHGTEAHHLLSGMIT